ncbi:hypothetical protein EYZ11_013345 [Aspergillus tanneri]|uniref:Uncharacterized protein n=1 Tax=Aspergillus tanneri TaxID=1220188 RepID=A0A4S3J037_9EURO|nr:hypothetical protein EYZ11_013345 [Aspergillus tanneri]
MSDTYNFAELREVASSIMESDSPDSPAGNRGLRPPTTPVPETTTTPASNATSQVRSDQNKNDAKRPSTTDTLPLRTISDSVNLNDIRKMVPKLSKDNADRWFNIFEEAVDSKKLWWIIAGPEQPDGHANRAITVLIRQLVPDSEHDLLDQYDTAKKQFKALKKKWQSLRPGVAREKLAEFYSYRKPEDISIRDAHDQLRRMARKLRARLPHMREAVNEKTIFN